MIKSVIFDWGGVLAENASDGFIAYCVKKLSVDGQKFQQAYQNYETSFWKGQISEKDLLSKIYSNLGRKDRPPPNLWINALRSTYLPKEDVVSIVKKLHKKGYKTALLSNTEKPTAEFFKTLHYDFFDVTIFSCDIGMIKPNEKIYRKTLEALKTVPSETLFVDDKLSYISGAKKLGINTILFKNSHQLVQKMKTLSISI